MANWNTSEKLCRKVIQSIEMSVATLWSSKWEWIQDYLWKMNTSWRMQKKDRKEEQQQSRAAIFVKPTKEFLLIRLAQPAPNQSTAWGLKHKPIKRREVFQILLQFCKFQSIFINNFPSNLQFIMLSGRLALKPPVVAAGHRPHRWFKTKVGNQ